MSAVVARRFASLVRLEHTVFALPYAYAGALIGARGVPSASALGWITVAMVGARSFAMAVNRLVDHEIDARNPRTANRELPAGLLSRRAVTAFALVALALFVVACYQLAPAVRPLWPIALVALVGYPYLKRLTPFCHLGLGVAIGLAPIGAWIAVADAVEPEAFLLGSAVACWVAGFDVIYATADVDVDRREGLRSLPADHGLGVALAATRGLHVLTVGLLAWLGVAMELGVVYWLGVAVVACLLAYENAIVRPDDLSRVGAAFFTVNGVVAIVFGVAVALDVALA